MTLYFVVKDIDEDEGLGWQFVGDYFEDLEEARDHAFDLAQHSPGTTYEVWTATSVADYTADPEAVDVEIEESEEDEDEDE